MTSIARTVDKAREVVLDMELRISAEMNDKKNPADVTELILDGCKAERISATLKQFVNLKRLCLRDIGLTTLEGLPELPHLQMLYLTDNQIKGGLEVLQTSPLLRNLDLTANKINSLEVFHSLKPLKRLRYLDVLLNDLPAGYTMKLFSLLPSVKYIDGFDALDELPRRSEDEETFDEEPVEPMDDK